MAGSGVALLSISAVRSVIGRLGGLVHPVSPFFFKRTFWTLRLSRFSWDFPDVGESGPGWRYPAVVVFVLGNFD